MSVEISAVICTHNRARYLPKAIRSLVEQRTAKDRFEIIVVDNASTDGTRDVVHAASNGCDIRYVYEPRLGLSYARETGWRSARGGYVAYLDDDAIASPGWLDTILEVFATVRPRPGCVGGKVEPIWEHPRPAWLSDQLLHGLAVLDWSDSPHVLEDLACEWLAGVNFAIPVDVLRETGGFTPRLDRVGRQLLSSGDVFLEKAIKKRGHSCFYHPRMAVKHHIAKERLDQRWFLRRYFWQGVTDAVMRILEEQPSTSQRLRSAAARGLDLVRTPRKLRLLLTPTTDPRRFTERCFAAISAGHVYGLLTVAR